MLGLQKYIPVLFSNHLKQIYTRTDHETNEQQ